MPTYKVLCRKDAFIDYVAKVRASSPEDAVAKAADDHESYVWELHSDQEFEAAVYIALDASGNEVEGTELQVG